MQERSHFPAYDLAWKQAPAIAVVSEERPSQTSGGLVGNVQHALNLARRVEQKLIKLRTEQLQRSRGWDKYMADVKEAVAKEKSRHENAQARIAKEIQELESSQTAAYEQVTAVAMEMKGQGGLFGQATASYVEPPGMEVDLGLDQRSRAGQDSSLSDADLAAELRRIIGVVQMREANRVAPPSTPPRRHGGHPALTPPATTSARPNLDAAQKAADPYPSPLSTAQFGTGTPQSSRAPHEHMPEAGHPVVAQPEPAPSSKEGMCEVPLPVPNDSVSPLQEQLRVRRQEARKAMEPFGIPGKLNSQQQPPPPGDSKTTAPTTQSIIQDDDEELDSASAMNTSPGLGKLE